MNAITFNPNYVPLFESNQVLKDSDLNDIVTYLDSHNRLTRTHLIGMGIVCGLEVKLSKDRSTIRISAGCGITSAGFFVEYLPTADDRFTHYREEQIPKQQLIPTESESENFQIQELISAAAARQANDKNQPLTNLNLNDKVAIIFCQWDDKDRDSCLVDCDNRGRDRNFRLRFFLVDKTNNNSAMLSAEKLLKSGFDIKIGTSLISAFQGWFEVPDCQIDRLDRLTQIDDFSKLVAAYSRICRAGISSIETALKQTHQLFNPFISTFQPPRSDLDDLDEIGTRLNRILDELAAAANGNASPQVSYGIQYFYDYLVELIAAFNELKTALFDLMDECPPNMQWFPKYLLAGAVMPEIQPCAKPDIYRHAFYQPPIYNGNRQRKQEVRHLYERLVRMSNKFQLLPFYQTPVKITPSRTRQAPLSDRAIPYYYSYPDLYPYWNYDACRQQRADRIPAYFRLNRLPNTRGYDLIPRIDWVDFFRIEGHLGLPVNTAIKRIERDRDDFNLAFDLVVVKLGAGQEDPDLLRGYFDDLEVEFDRIKLDWQQKYEREKARIEDRNILNILASFNEYFFRQSDLQKIDRGLMQNDFLEAAKNPDNYQFRSIENEDNNFKLVLNIQIKRPFRIAVLTDRGADTQTNRTKKIALADASYREQNQVRIREIFANDFSSDFSILQLENDDNTRILRFVIDAGIENIELVGTDSDLSSLSIRLEDETPYNFDTLIERYHDFDALFTLLKYFGERSQTLTPEAAARLVSYYEFRALFNHYLLRLESAKQMQLLTEYAKHHPGLEHLGGVPNGGTLVLVYTNDPVVIERTIVADLNLLKSSNLDVRDIEKQAQFPPDRLSGTERLPVIDRSGENVVVADFCLPYLCCSAYSNLNYVVAQPKPFISLPQPVYCEGDTKIYDFILEPPGGLLKGGDGVVMHNGNYAFQPSTVDADVTEPMNLTFFYIVDGVGSSYSILLLPHVEIEFSIKPSDNPICVSAEQTFIQLNATPPGGRFQLSIDDNSFQNIVVNETNQFDLSSLFASTEKNKLDLRFIYKVPSTDDYCGGTSEPLPLTAIRQLLAQINYRKNAKGQAIGTLVYNRDNCSDLKLRVKFQNSGSIADNYEWRLNNSEEPVSRDRDVEIEIPYAADRKNVTLIARNDNSDTNSCPGQDEVEVTLAALDPSWNFDNRDLPTKTDESGESIIVLCRLGNNTVTPQPITVEQPGGTFSSEPKGLVVDLADNTLPCKRQTQYLLDVANTSAGTYTLTYTAPDSSQFSRLVEVVVVPVGSFKLNVENQSEAEFQVRFVSIAPRRGQGSQLRYEWEIKIGDNPPVTTEETTNTFQYAGDPAINPGDPISVVMRISDPSSLCVTSSEPRTATVPAPPEPIG